MNTPGSLSEAMNSVGATDALTMPTQGTGLVNAGGGLEGLTSAGMGTGSSGYPLLDATAGAGTDSMSSSLLDNLKDYATDKLKNPNTYKDLLKMFGQGDQQQGYNSALSSALRGGTGPMRSLQGGAAGGQWFNPNS